MFKPTYLTTAFIKGDSFTTCTGGVLIDFNQVFIEQYFFHNISHIPDISND